jgi:hypothetical protein
MGDFGFMPTSVNGRWAKFGDFRVSRFEDLARVRAHGGAGMREMGSQNIGKRNETSVELFSL